eukprot:Awhi_evm1s3266
MIANQQTSERMIRKIKSDEAVEFKLHKGFIYFVDLSSVVDIEEFDNVYSYNEAISMPTRLVSFTKNSYDERSSNNVMPHLPQKSKPLNNKERFCNKIVVMPTYDRPSQKGNPPKNKKCDKRSHTRDVTHKHSVDESQLASSVKESQQTHNHYINIIPAFKKGIAKIKSRKTQPKAQQPKNKNSSTSRTCVSLKQAHSNFTPTELDERRSNWVGTTSDSSKSPLSYRQFLQCRQVHLTHTQEEQSPDILMDNNNNNNNIDKTIKPNFPFTSSDLELEYTETDLNKYHALAYVGHSRSIDDSIHLARSNSLNFKCTVTLPKIVANNDSPIDNYDDKNCFNNKNDDDYWDHIDVNYINESCSQSIANGYLHNVYDWPQDDNYEYHVYDSPQINK